ncbi:hypothetical protein KHQ81_13130 [Mycoplasmatota bacterium]|nr:hypothetical protein KHQ81_13130 [Mycoplasmatota bacterium]
MIYKHKINNFSWGDLLLSELKLDGDNIIIKVLEKDNNIKTISCEEFIGIKCLGKWEESLIDSISVDKKGDVIVESVFKIRNNYELPYNTINSKSIFYPWVQLNIKLVDGCFVKIACKDTYLEG